MCIFPVAIRLAMCVAMKVVHPSTFYIMVSPCMYTCCGQPPAHCMLHSSSNLEGNTLLSFYNVFAMKGCIKETQERAK